jgi:hypothetical protein
MTLGLPCVEIGEEEPMGGSSHRGGKGVGHHLTNVERRGGGCRGGWVGS